MTAPRNNSCDTITPMSSIFFDDHNGLGDEILCNGLVRELCKEHDRVGIFCLKRSYPTVSFMYRDLKNLRIHVPDSHREIAWFPLFNFFRFGNDHYDIVRITGEIDLECSIRFDRQYYQLAGVTFEKKWDSFYVERDMKREENLLKKIGISEPYQFVHDDSRFPLDRSRISPALPVLEPTKGLSDNVFDFCTAIERATEIHVVDSSFINLIDLLPYKNDAQQLYKHQYARTNPAWHSPLLKKAWTILT